MLAIFYDALCLLALFFLATLLLVICIGGEAVGSDNIIYDLYLLFITYLYFSWFWVNGGRTVGMNTWHIRVCDNNLRRLTWRKATLRFCLACVSLFGLGFGFCWALFDRQQQTFHDRYSRTLLFHEPVASKVSTQASDAINT